MECAAVRNARSEGAVAEIIEATEWYRGDQK